MALRATVRFVLLTVVATGSLPVSAQTAQAPMSNTERLAALELSQKCRDAGNTFVVSFKASAVTDKNTFVTSSTHYNRRLNKCMVEINSTVFGDKGFRSSLAAVFDSIDDVEYTEIITMMRDGDTSVDSCYTTNAALEQVPCVKDRRLWNIARSAYDKQRNELMTQ